MAKKERSGQADLFTGTEHKWYDVPPGTRASTCSARTRGGTCTQIVYWISYEAPDRKNIGQTRTVKQPIDCSVPGGNEPSVNLPGVEPRKGSGVSHYVTCVDRKLFKR